MYIYVLRERYVPVGSLRGAAGSTFSTCTTQYLALQQQLKACIGDDGTPIMSSLCRCNTELEAMKVQLLKRIKQRRLLGWRAQDVDLQSITIELPGEDALETQDINIAADASCCIASAESQHEKTTSADLACSEEL